MQATQVVKGALVHVYHNRGTTHGRPVAASAANSTAGAPGACTTALQAGRTLHNSL
jgi:hypothetical protein